MGTTFRTAEYERRVPYSVLSNGARDLIAENASKREPVNGNYQDVLLKQFKNEKAKTADELVEAYPFIDELADEMVNARLGLYNKAPTYDKSEGWIENLEDIQQPYPLEFTVVNGEPVLIDLGLIKKRGTGVTDPIVRHGRGLSIIDGKPVGVGTLDYAAPEQLLKGEASVQSDVFALGKMLRSLYGGNPPSCLKRVIRTATRELPDDRYESADAFASALRRVYLVRGASAALLVAVLVAGIAALNHRAELRKWAIGVLDPPQRVLTVVKAPDEPAAAYIARLKKIAEGGSAVAQCALAEAYMYGQGTETNAEEAVRWYRKSAGQGNSDAQASLGLCKLRGIGCEKDVFDAVKWYTLAAEQKNLSAMNDLAFCKMHGIGIDKDEAGAFALALEAAKSGHAPAQAMVGECYLEGMGVEQDIAAAETWLYRAARLGNVRAKKLLETR